MASRPKILPFCISYQWRQNGRIWNINESYFMWRISWDVGSMDFSLPVFWFHHRIPFFYSEYTLDRNILGIFHNRTHLQSKIQNTVFYDWPFSNRWLCPLNTHISQEQLHVHQLSQIAGGHPGDVPKHQIGQSAKSGHPMDVPSMSGMQCLIFAIWGMSPGCLYLMKIFGHSYVMIRMSRGRLDNVLIQMLFHWSPLDVP